MRWSITLPLVTQAPGSTPEAGLADAIAPTLELLDVVGCGIWTYDGTDTRFVNRALAEITGYSCEELLQAGFFEHLIHPEDRDMIVERGRARVRGEEPPERYEIRIIHKTGEVRHLALHARRLDLATGPVSVVSAMDVTQWRDAERTIRDGTSAVIELLDSVPAHVITTNIDGKPTFVNRHWLEHTGQPHAEAMERGTAPLIHPDDVERATTAWLAAMRSGVGYDIEYRVTCNTGEYRWQQFRIRPLRNAAGTLNGWTSASVDVHESTELRRELERTNDQLEEAMRAKDEVLGMISHELRTPLTTLLGNARLLKRRGEQLSAIERHDVAADLEMDAVRLNAVIQNMLVLSHAGASGEVEMEPLRLERLAALAIEEFAVRNPHRTVKFECVPPLPLVLANPTYYQQILGNLLGNAAKYSPAEGAITVQLAADGPVMATRVLDEGAGIPDAELRHVFDPFYRSNRHTSVYGIGLGLTVCQRLAEIQGGTISVRNRPEGGCEFTFTTSIVEDPDGD